jgi:sucrose phosphorylase
LKNQVQLITYVDRLAGNFRQLPAILNGSLADACGGVHLLPFFAPIDAADAGFDPIDHTEVDSRLGDRNDVRALSEHVEVVADLIVSHISRASPQFRDLSENGANSAFAGIFLTFNRVFSMGARATDLLRIYRPRPGLPFIDLQLETGERCLLWTTFTPQQVDIDVQHPHGHAYLTSILARFQSAGIRTIRLDAVGYAIKKVGTSCFMIPETFQFIASLTSQIHSLGMEVLVGIHSHYLQQVEIASKVDWVCDFALPPLIPHSLFARDAKALGPWIFSPAGHLLQTLDRTEYEVADSQRIGVQAHS